MKSGIKSILLLFIIFLNSGYIGVGEDEICISKEEKKLLDLLEKYRKKHGLPEIDISYSLTKVAKIHAKDLHENNPHDKPNCNLHSWSKGDNRWSSCCYTPDHSNSECMWEKPGELTEYKGYGFEIASYKKNEIEAEDAINMWTKSPHHENVIINKRKWKDTEWKAIGVGIYKNYATVWFGKKKDETREIEMCESSKE